MRALFLFICVAWGPAGRFCGPLGATSFFRSDGAVVVSWRLWGWGEIAGLIVPASGPVDLVTVLEGLEGEWRRRQ